MLVKVPELTKLNCKFASDLSDSKGEPEKEPFRALKLWHCCNTLSETDGLNNKQLFLIVLESGNSKIKMPTYLVLHEDPRPVCTWISSH